MLRATNGRSTASPAESGSRAILLANVLFITATFPNPLALRAAPFTKGGFWVPSFIKGGTGRISPAVSIIAGIRIQPCCGIPQPSFLTPRSSSQPLTPSHQPLFLRGCRIARRDEE